MATHIVILSVPGSGTWIVPSDWNSSNNTIEGIGCGGTGGVGPDRPTYGGGGGQYSITNNINLTPGSTVNFNVGVAGGAGSGQNSRGIPSAPVFGDTWFINALTTFYAQGGSNAQGTANPGVGGNNIVPVGSQTSNNGGDGGVFTAGPGGAPGSGGGGAGGPNGVGAQGGAATPNGSLGGSGGGGANGGSTGGNNSGSTGGTGGNNRLGSGGGTGALGLHIPGGNGTDGGGGGGGGEAGLGGNGSMEVVWTVGAVDYGPGSGGGGGGNSFFSGGSGGSGGNGGGYGGAGGGFGWDYPALPGAGTQGLIIITYDGSPVSNEATWSAAGAGSLLGVCRFRRQAFASVNIGVFRGS